MICLLVLTFNIEYDNALGILKSGHYLVKEEGGGNPHRPINIVWFIVAKGNTYVVRYVQRRHNDTT